MKSQANRTGINILAFIVIVCAVLAGAACESSSRPVANTIAVAPVEEVSVSGREALGRSFRVHADAAALATRNEVTVDLAIRLHTDKRMQLASTETDKRG